MENISKEYSTGPIDCQNACDGYIAHASSGIRLHGFESFKKQIRKNLMSM